MSTADDNPPPAATRRLVDPPGWAQISPWLDRLLDADEFVRPGVLAQAAALDTALAAELADLLRRLDAQDAEAFMQTPAEVAALAGRDDASAAGQRIGAYVVQRLLGRGGMGSVWLARRADGRFDGEVAIKLLHGGLYRRGDARRFAREGQILARLDHPHIARLLDAGATADEGGQPFLVLEFVPGSPIDEHVRRQGLDTRATVGLFLDVLAAVGHAHERLILHRDLKPSNILVTPQGLVKLLDFGIAKLVADSLDQAQATQLTQQAGRAYTLRFAAPEQVEGGEATTATDVYSLGVLLHLLLTGGLHPTALADTDTPLAQLQALVHAAPRRPSDAVARHGGAQARKLTRALRGDLDTIVGRALKKQPHERYRNAAELADELVRYLKHEPIAARPDGRVYRLAKFLRRNPLGMAAAGSVLLAIGIGTALALHSAREAQAQRTLATQRSEQAESLIGFMLNDLRDKLEPVGRLDVLSAVATKVLGYYEQQDAASLDVAALGQRGQALTLVGRMAEKRGEFAEAERSHVQAVASLAELARREPDDPQRLLAYSEALNQLGQVQQHRGDWAGAEASLRQALLLNSEAYSLRPEQGNLIEVVAAQINLAVFYVQANRPAEGLALLQEAHPAAVRIAQRDPSEWHSVGILRGELAEAQYQLGHIADSLDTLQSNLQALAQVPKGETNRRVQLSRARTLTRMAGVQLTIGQPDAAVKNYAEAVQTDVDLTQHDPANLDYLATLVRHRLFLIEALAWAGDTSQALSQLHLTDKELKLLQERADAPLAWRMLLPGLMLLRQALLTPEDERLPLALQTFVDEFSRSHVKDSQFTSEHHRMLARVGLQLGNVRAARGQRATAEAAWHRALAELDGSAPSTMASGTLAAAQLNWRLGNRDKAQVLVAQLDKGDYRSHPEYLAFRREMRQTIKFPTGN